MTSDIVGECVDAASKVVLVAHRMLQHLSNAVRLLNIHQIGHTGIIHGCCS